MPAHLHRIFLAVLLLLSAGLRAAPIAPSPATAVTLTGRSSPAISLSWTSGSGARRIVVARLTATANAVPVNGTEYVAASNSFSDASNPLTGTGNVVVYNGTGTSVTVSGLSALTTYSFFVYEYNGTGATSEYSTAASLTSQSTLAAAPSGQVSSSAFTFSGIGAGNVVKLDYPAASTVGGSGYLLLYKEGAGQSLGAGDLPVGGTTYAAGGSIGTATIAAVVTSSAQTTSNISGLTGSKHFTFFIVPYAGSNSGGTNSFNTAGTIGSRYVPSFSGAAASLGGETASLSSLVNTASITDNSQGFQVWQLSLSETDDDALPTILKSLTVSASANNQMGFSTAIRSAALFQGSSLLGQAVISGNQLQFTGLSLTIPDNGSATLSLRISLLANVNGGASTGANKDGDRFAFQLSNANVSADVAANSSQFASFAAITSAASGSNLYSVSATLLRFAQAPPAATDPYVTIAPTVTVEGVDAGGNRDIDNNAAVTISGGPGLSGTLTRTPSAGLATFTGMYLTTPGSTSLSAANGTLTTGAASVRVNDVQNVGVFAFNGTSCNAGTLVASGAAAGFSFGSVSYNGLTCNSSGNSGGVQALSVSTTWPAAFDNTKYIEFTVSPAAGWRINPTALAFEIYRSTNGATSYAVRSSVDGFASDIVSGTTNTSATATVLPLPAAFLGRTGATTFRLYGWGGTSGDLRLDNLMLRGYAGIPLPVSLIRFTGKRTANANELTWTTASESNNRGFAIERGTDGINFNQVSFVTSRAAGGNSTSDINYLFIDASAGSAGQLATGKWYYRLKQEDLDGHSKYSAVVLLKGDKSGIITLDGIYPNPVKGATSIRLQASAQGGSVLLQVTDMQGRMVRQQNVLTEAGASTTVNLDLAGLAAGQYHLKAIAVNGEASEAVTVVKL
ncbi:MAG: T9SS type A sorting domain-containing protein [Chitinophagaceae bacterium]|nr:MAG: T9SS type A sorting domain-containing protein [Chitinophagaceae bacterium]